MTLIRSPFIPVKAWFRRFYADPSEVCARCGAAYESVLHRLCANEQRVEETKAGWR